MPKKTLILCDNRSDRKDMARLIAKEIVRLGGEWIWLGFDDLIFKNSALTLDFNQKATQVILHQGKKKVSFGNQLP